MNRALTALDADVELFVRFAQGDIVAHALFFKRHRQALLTLARIVSPTLPPDLHEDMVQIAGLFLLDRNIRFEPKRASLSSYLRTVMKNAARTLREGFTSPGQPKRPTVDANGRYPKPARSLSETQICPDGTERQLAELIPDGENNPFSARMPSITDAEDAVYAEQAQTHAVRCGRSTIPRALRVLLQGGTVSDASRVTLVPRPTLHRHLKRWGVEFIDREDL